MPMRRVIPVLPLLLFITFSGCYFMRGSSGGGEADFSPPRHVNPADIVLPAGFRIQPVVQGLTFPTSVCFDDAGTPYVVEAGYSYGEAFAEPRLLRVDSGGHTTVVASGKNNGPWTAAYYYKGHFYITEGGEMEGGRILRASADGRTSVLVEGLPSTGDHHTNSAVVGPDGYIYFGQGTATNSAVVGPDNFKFGWLKRKPEFHDIPCSDIVLVGTNFDSENPLLGKGQRASTGAYSPFGRSTTANQKITGEIPCNGAIMRLPLEGGNLELVAWGFRNPFGLAFASDSALYATDNGYDERGSRPVWGAGDVLWKIEKGAWYGWPDFSAGDPLTKDEYKAPGDPAPGFVLAQHPSTPQKPVAIFGVHSSSNGLDFSRNKDFGYAGEAFVAQFGDEAPVSGKILAPVGYKVVRVDVDKGIITDFAVNKGYDNGPASLLGTGGLERPVAVRFDPSGTALYIVDFGVMLQSKKGSQPQPGTGMLWKVTRE